ASGGAVPNKASAWIGNSNSGDDSGSETEFEFMMGETETFNKFYCRLSTAAAANVSFLVFDSVGNPISAACVITTGSTSNSITTPISLSAGSVYAVKASIASGTFGGGGPNAWWALGQQEVRDWVLTNIRTKTRRRGGKKANA